MRGDAALRFLELVLERDSLIADSFASFSFFGSAEAEALAVAVGDGDLDSHQCEFSHSLSRSVMSSTARATRLRGQEYPHLVKSPFRYDRSVSVNSVGHPETHRDMYRKHSILRFLGVTTTMYIGQVPRQEWRSLFY